MSASQLVCESLESRRLYSFTTFSLPAAPNRTGDAYGAVHIAAGPGNSIWVTDPAHARIIELGSDGKSRQFLLGKYAGPTAIVAGRDGTMWFIDETDNRIGRITSGGQVKEFAIPGPKKKPYMPTALTLGPDGNIWFTATYSDIQNPIGGRGGSSDLGDFPFVARISPAGKVREFHLTENVGFTPHQIVSWRGSLWVANNQNLVQVSTTGKSTVIPGDVIDGFEEVRPDGYLGGPGYSVTIANGKAVYEFNRDFTGQNVYVMTNGAANASDGNIWFANVGFNNTALNSIGYVRVDGSVTTVAAPNDDAISDITVGGDGNLWMVSTDLAHVYQLKLDGSALPQGPEPAPGTVSEPGLQTADVTAGTRHSVTVATFVAGAADAVASDFSASVKWQDGSTTAGTITATGDGSFTISTSFLMVLGPNTATVTIHANQTSESDVVKAYFNGVLSLATATGVNVSAVGAQVFQGNVADLTNVDLAALAQYTTFITWGDGSSSLGQLVADGHGGAFVMGSHRFESSGQFGISIYGITPSYNPGLTGTTNDTYRATSTATVSAGNVEGTGFIARGFLYADDAPKTQLLAIFTPTNFVAADLSHYHAIVSWRPSGTINDDPAPMSAPLTLTLNSQGGFDATLAITPALVTELEQDYSQYAVTLTDDRLGKGAAAVADVACGYFDLGGSDNALVATALDYDVKSLNFPYWFDPNVLGFVTANSQAVASDNTLQMTANHSATVEVGTFSNMLSGIYADNEFGAYVEQPLAPVVLHGVIRWGDGTSSAASFTVDSTGVVHVSGTHAYSTAGHYSVEVVVTQDSPTKPPPLPTFPKISLPLMESNVTVT